VALHDHEVPETAVHHGRRGVLKGPLARREDQVLRAVLPRGLGVGAFARGHGVEDVPLGEDADAGVFGVDHDGGSDFSDRHHAGGLSECVRGADHQHLLGHSVCHLHGRVTPRGLSGDVPCANSGCICPARGRTQRACELVIPNLDLRNLFVTRLTGMFSRQRNSGSRLWRMGPGGNLVRVLSAVREPRHGGARWCRQRSRPPGSPRRTGR